MKNEPFDAQTISAMYKMMLQYPVRGAWRTSYGGSDPIHLTAEYFGISDPEDEAGLQQLLRTLEWTHLFYLGVTHGWDDTPALEYRSPFDAASGPVDLTSDEDYLDGLSHGYSLAAYFEGLGMLPKRVQKEVA